MYDGHRVIAESIFAVLQTELEIPTTMTTTSTKSTTTSTKSTTTSTRSTNMSNHNASCGSSICEGGKKTDDIPNGTATDEKQGVYGEEAAAARVIVSLLPAVAVPFAVVWNMFAF